MKFPNDIGPLIARRMLETEATESPAAKTFSGLTISESIVDLAALYALTNEDVRLNLTGKKLYMPQFGTMPGTRFTLSIAGGTVQEFFPGSRLVTPFSGVTIKRHPACATLGTARLLAFADPSQDLIEPPNLPYSSPVNLFSAYSTGASVTPIDISAYAGVSPDAYFGYIPCETVPTSYATNLWWNVAGWSKLRIYLISNGFNTTSLTMIPWFKWNNTDGNGFFENGLSAISVPDSAVTGYAQRILSVDLTAMSRPGLIPSDNAGIPMMTFEFRDTGRTSSDSFGLFVQGVA
jgi:hypothetical protein